MKRSHRDDGDQPVTEANWQRESFIFTTDYFTVLIWYHHSHVLHRKIVVTIEENKENKSQYQYICDSDNC